MAARGLPEYETAWGKHAVTLIRCTGRIGDWGQFPTPSAQEPGFHAFELAFIPHSVPIADSTFADLEARLFHDVAVGVPVDHYRGFVAKMLVDLRLSDLEVLAHTPAPSTPYALLPSPFMSAPYYTQSSVFWQVNPLSPFLIEPHKLVLSSFKKSESLDAIIVRLYNPYSYSLMGSISSDLSFKVVYRCNLDETHLAKEILEKLTTSVVLSFEINAKEILTFEFS